MKKLWGNSSTLNKPGFHSVSAIAYRVTVSKGYGSKKWWTSGSLQISDCTRAIELDLDASTKEQLENSMYKLDTIIQMCEQAKKDIQTAHDKAVKQTEKGKKK